LGFLSSSRGSGFFGPVWSWFLSPCPHPGRSSFSSSVVGGGGVVGGLVGGDVGGVVGGFVGGVVGGFVGGVAGGVAGGVVVVGCWATPEGGELGGETGVSG
jgi:hypothetical protein